jgi:hypothetical protein
VHSARTCRNGQDIRRHSHRQGWGKRGCACEDEEKKEADEDDDANEDVEGSVEAGDEECEQ